MDIRKVKRLVEMLENSNLEEIEIKEGEESVRLVKSLGSQQSFQPQSIVLPQETQPGVTPQAIETPEEVVKESNSINSPMVGTFYASASPESKPFVTIGQTIKKGDTLCILEAMKMMNQVQAESDGKIIEILVNNAEPVEFDQPLFVIE